MQKISDILWQKAQVLQDLWKNSIVSSAQGQFDGAKSYDAATGKLCWQPKQSNVDHQFLAPVERALEVELNWQLHEYYSAVNGYELTFTLQEQAATLILLWKAEERDGLCENLILHGLQKKRQKIDYSFFIGLLDETGENIVINNRTGQVWLESLTGEPKTCLAENLYQFLQSIEPIKKRFEPMLPHSEEPQKTVTQRMWQMFSSLFSKGK